MLYRSNLKTTSILIIAYIAIFLSINNFIKTHATITFDIKVIESKVSDLSGQIYYSNNGAYTGENSKHFVLRRDMYNIYQIVNIPLYDKTIKYIRLDPLADAGEIMIKDFSILQGSWNHKKIQEINLKHINLKKLHNLEIIKKEKSFLHLLATGPDPYMQIENNLDIRSSIINYGEIIKISIISLLVLMLFVYIMKGIRSNYLKIEELLTVLILITYSFITVLYSNRTWVIWLIIGVPIIGLYIIYKQGPSNYILPIKNIIGILSLLTIVVLISDLANDKHQIYSYFSFIQYILSAMIIAIIFIQKKSFNYHFYKYFLLTFTVSIALFTTTLHFDIIRIDTVIAFGHRMSQHPWTQKNYMFWYLFLMWGTISFFYFSKLNKKDLFAILLILTTSCITIMSGYSDSAKLAFFLSLFIYLLFSFIKFDIKTLLFIPILISLYIFLMPWISDIIIYLSSLHERLAYREKHFALASALVKENLLFGYGYKTEASLLLQDFLAHDLLQKYGFKYLPGKNPHNIPLLIWLNFGAIGAFLFSFLIYLSMKKFILLTYTKNNQPALLGIISSFMIITTFSWSGWWPVTFLTYGFFVAMIFLSMNNKLARL